MVCGFGLFGCSFIPPLCLVCGCPDGQRLPLNQRQRVASNGTLAITLVDKSDSGGYFCSVTEARAVRREIQVNVVGKYFYSTHTHTPLVT
jgi:hypothetical protein